MEFHDRRPPGEPDFIPGIYNYCDRWCDRCPFTARCLHFALARQSEPGAPPPGVSEPHFWADLRETLETALHRLQAMARESGLDPDALARGAAPPGGDLQHHPLAHASRVYAQLVADWLERAEPLLEAKEQTLRQEAALDLPGPEADALTIEEALDVLRWYQFQIHVKLMRALRGREANRQRAGSGDADGSAKVALVGIDRSLDAWRTLWPHLPEAEDDLLERMLLLDRLRREVERVFPAARAFTRPGFDAEAAERG